MSLATDSARCQYIAAGETPGVDVGTIFTGRAGRDVAINFGLGILEGIAQTAAVTQNFDRCMQQIGYVAVAPGAAPPALAATPIPLVPTGAPVGAPLPPGTPVPSPAVVDAVLPPASACPPGSDPRWLAVEFQREATLLCRPFVSCVEAGACHLMYAGLP